MVILSPGISGCDLSPVASLLSGHPSALAAGKIRFPIGRVAAARVPGPALLRLSWTRERDPSPGCFVGGGADWDTSAPRQTPFWGAEPGAWGEQ